MVATLIDNIFTNDVNNNMDNYVLIDDITDHLPVATVITNVETCKSVYAAVKKRNLSCKNIVKFKRELQDITWCNVFAHTNADTCYDQFLSEFLSKLDVCCKMVKSNAKHKINKPWLTPGLINACKKKRIICINIG